MEASTDFRKLFQKPLVRVSCCTEACRRNAFTQSVDMNAEVSSEAVEVVTMAIDKFAASQKKFGPAWHVCIGEGFGFEVTYQARHMLYLFYGEHIGVLVFKY
jgi:hypothetical protein